jgi:hypothetical protein
MGVVALVKVNNRLGTKNDVTLTAKAVAGNGSVANHRFY